MRYPLFLVRQLGRTVSKKLVRTGARHLPFLAKDRTRRLERWLRGREDWRKLRLADAVVVSFGKSGRTWLRVLLSRVYQLQHGLGERAVIGFDNLHYQADGCPRSCSPTTITSKTTPGTGRPRQTSMTRR